MLGLLVIQVIWFHLPAGVANMAPVFAAKLFPRWDLPIDLGKTFRGGPLFGSHKTFRGFAAGILLAVLVFYLQKIGLEKAVIPGNWTSMDYSRQSSLLMGTVMGLGALGGDLVKSFFKRRINIGPGKSWIPFDQVDWILGNLLLTWPWVGHSWELIIASLVIGLLLSFLARVIGYYLGLNKDLL